MLIYFTKDTSHLCTRHVFWGIIPVHSWRAGAEDQGETGSSKEENQPRDHRAERQTKGQQRKHQPPEGRDQKTRGG